MTKIGYSRLVFKDWRERHVRICSTCKKEKDLDLFPNNAQGFMGKKSVCKECNVKTQKKWSNNNKEKMSEYSKKWYQSGGKNISHIYNKKWRKENRAYDAERAGRRRASLVNATPRWAELDKIEVIYQKAMEYGLTVDHIVPIRGKNVCGLHVWHNLQLLDNSINCAKRHLYWPDMP